MIYAKQPRSLKKYFRSLETSDHRKKDRLWKTDSVSFKPSVSARLQSELLSFCFSSVSLHWDDGKWRNFRSQTQLPVLRFFYTIFWFLGLIFRYSSRRESLRFSRLLEYRTLFQETEVSDKKKLENWQLCVLKFFSFSVVSREERKLEKKQKMIEDPIVISEFRKDTSS